MNVEETLRRVGLGVGLVVLVIGVALQFAPSIAETVPVRAFAIDLLGVLALLLGLWTVRERYRARQNAVNVPSIERRLATPSPGSEVDDFIYRITELREGTLEYREQIRERVANIAVAVIMYRHDCSREQAIERLEGGTWTDDAAARNFFVGGGASTQKPLLDRIPGVSSSSESQYEEQLRRTVEALEDVADFDFADDAGGDEPSRALNPASVRSAEDGQQVAENVRYRSLVRTHHWTGITAFAFLALAVGVITSQAALLLASAVGIGVAGYTRVTPPPALSDLAVTREVDDESPKPGDEIEATVTVTNEGAQFLSDLTFVDQLPPTMEVVGGSARLGTALRPGDSATFRYTAVAERGEHDWPLQVIGRDPSGSVEREAMITPDATVDCHPYLKSITEMPVRMQTTMFSGEVDTDIGGEGLEFYSVRDYQPGDPKRRIDWKSYARTGEFSTIEFQKEQAARAVLMFDARDSSYVSSTPGEKHALDRSVDMASDIYASLNDQGHLVGIAAFNGIPCWLGPNTGTLHQRRVREALTSHPALSPLPPELSEKEEGRYIDPLTHIRRQLPKDTQVFLFSPLTDEYAYEVARQLDGAGHLVTVISPDPTTGQSIGQRIARLERAVLIKQLRDHQIRVIDQPANTDMNVELERAKRRWGQ